MIVLDYAFYIAIIRRHHIEPSTIFMIDFFKDFMGVIDSDQAQTRWAWPECSKSRFYSTLIGIFNIMGNYNSQSNG